MPSFEEGDGSREKVVLGEYEISGRSKIRMTKIAASNFGSLPKERGISFNPNTCASYQYFMSCSLRCNQLIFTKLQERKRNKKK